MQVIERLAPLGHNCRPGINRRGFRGVTIHNTSNWSNGANALAHANLLRNGWKDVYTSWHYVVDKDYAVRCVPENEVAWCQGDGNGDGNMTTISIEICDNADGDIRKATDNAVELCADILRRNGITNVNGHLFQHNYWTGKDCPYDIRRGNPYDWGTFCNKVQQALNGGGEVVDQIIHAGSKVKFNGVFRIDDLILPCVKYPNGAVGCYATCYGKPIGVDDWLPSGPLSTCNADGSNANPNGILDTGGYWKCDKVFNVISTELPTRYTPNGVATLEADGVRFRVDCGPLLEV
jgi:hypothetical protein